MSTRTDERTLQAEAFLREAVFRSRTRQAVEGVLSPATGDVGNCGLGKQAAVVLDLDERGRELFETLFSEGLDDTGIESVHEVMSDWIQRQDALDRKRNHFLKDFRQRHGFDRAQYEDEQLRAYDDGLAAVNAEVDGELRAAAERLLTR